MTSTDDDNADIHVSLVVVEEAMAPPVTTMAVHIILGQGSSEN